MLHSPISPPSKQQATWKALEDLVKEGTIKSLGVSNFNSHELIILSKTDTIQPTVTQNKGDVYHVGKQIDPDGDPILSYLRENSMKLVAYSSFSAYPFVMVPLYDPIISYIASVHPNKPSNSQIILLWQLQHDMIVIPRSSNVKNLEANFNVLKLTPLTEKQMKLIDSLQYLIESHVCKAINF